MRGHAKPVRRRLPAIVLAASASLSCLQTPLASETRTNERCRGDPDLVGACFTVHGRLSVWNGTPGLRIWVVGTNRILGVHNDDTDTKPAGYPACLLPNIGSGKELFADFEVCPYTADQPGSMRFICIQSASGMVLSDSRGVAPDQSSRVSKVSGTCSINSGVQ